MISNIFWSWLTVISISLFLVKVTESACSSGYIQLDEDCYRFYETHELNYASAEEMCADDDAHLAYIPDCNKFKAIIRYLRSSDPAPGGSGFWIGATDENVDGNWFWGNGFPVAMGVPFWGTSGDNWDPEPNGGPNENCAQLSSSDQYYFHDEDCEGYGSPLCQKDSLQESKTHSESLPELGKLKEKGYNSEAVSCPDGFVYIGKSCYFFGTNLRKETAADARTYCNGMNAVLPVLKDCLEFQELVVEIEKNYDLGRNESYWVGATDQASEGTWIWTDFSDLEKGPPFWGSTYGTPEPSGGSNQNCGILYKNDRYYLHDGECNIRTKILCQASPIITSKKNEYP